MAKKVWCLSSTHPLAIQVAEKYGLKKQDARTIINNAKAADQELQDDEITLSDLENSTAFKDALNVYIQKEVDVNDVLLKDLPGAYKNKKNIKDDIRNQLGIEYSEEEVEAKMEMYAQLAEKRKLSRKSSKNIADVLRAFNDTRHLEFLGNWICKYMSEVMTYVETDASFREELGIKQKDRRKDYYKDVNTRNIIINTIIGKDGILTERMEALEKEGNEQLAKELRAVIKNFKTMLYIFGGRIFRDEGIEIDVPGNMVVDETANDAAEKNDNNEDNDEDNDDIGEITVNTFGSSEQNKSVTSKIVPSIKILLSNIHDVDSKGDEKEDPFGFGLHQYISVPLAINKLLTLCKGCQTYDEMFSVLEKNITNTYWLQQLLDALDSDRVIGIYDESESSASKKEQLQSMFFKSMRKQFTTMRVSYLAKDENGDLVIVNRDINVRHRSDKMLSTVKSYFRKATGLDIFDKGQIVFKRFTDFSKDYSIKNKNSIAYRLSSVYEEAQNLAKEGFRDEQIRNFSDQIKELNSIAEDLRSLLANYGLKISEELMNDYASSVTIDEQERNIFGDTYKDYGSEEFSTKYSRLQNLMKLAQTLNKNFIDWGTALNESSTFDNPFYVKHDAPGYKESKKIQGAYNRIIVEVTKFSPDSFESRGHANGKDYYSWNNPSSIGTIVENLTKGDKELVQRYMRRKYTEDALWFLRGNSTADNPRFYSDWMDEIYSGSGRSILEYSEKPLVCGYTYNEMSSSVYALSILNDYFTPIQNRKDTAWYRMLISSDKPRYSSIKFKRYADDSTDENGMWTEGNYHNVISRKAIPFFVQELKRSAEVIAYAAKGTGVKIKDYDIKINETNKHVFDKIKAGQRVTTDDVLSNGRYIFRNSGAAFYLNKFIMEEIENKTALGNYVVDVVFNNALLGKSEFLKPSIVGAFKTAFHKYMDSIKQETFEKYLNDGLFDPKLVPSPEPGGIATRHLTYLLGSMRAWHSLDENFGKRMMARTQEAQKIAKWYSEKSGTQSEADFSKFPEAKPYFCELAQFNHDLEEFVYNNWLAKANTSELFDVDLAFYKDTTNFQKRNAQVISSGYTPNPDAKIHGDLVSDKKYRSITVKTPITTSAHIQNLIKLLNDTAETITDPNQKKEYIRAKDDIIKKLSSPKDFDATDGQAWSSLTGLRKKMAGLGEWSRSNNKEMDRVGYVEENGERRYIYTDEAVYWRMKRGETRIEDLMHVFTQPRKPFVYSFVNMKRAGRGTITVPVQHKNSEYTLAFLSAFYAEKHPESQVAAIAAFMEETAENDITKGIDTVNFDSAIKIGNTSEAIDLSGLDGEQTLKALRKYYYSDKKNKTLRSDAVTEYDIEDYRIVQEKPEHFKKNAQPIGSQIKILAINNIKDDAIHTLPSGEQITGKELKKRYLRALRRKMSKAEFDFIKDLGLDVPRRNRLNQISYTLKQAMSTDQKFSAEMRRALSIEERNGEEQFVLPLDEAEQQGAIEAMLYSKIRRAYYKNKTNGGIVVQVSSWGASDDLAIRFYSSNPADAKRGGVCPTFAEFKREHRYGDKTEEKYWEYIKNYQLGYAWFECEVPMPDYVRKMIANPDGSIDEKYYTKDKNGNLTGEWNMDAIREVVPESVFDCIAYRVPTEAKYSMMVGKIVRFTPEFAGSAAKYPLEITRFTGSDFDIDTTTIEIRPIPGSRDENIDNEIFDLQTAALRSDTGIQETFRDGDFSDLRELSYYVNLLENGYSPETLDKMSPNQLKDECAAIENLDLMSPVTDIILHNQNTDAKDMIAIAAVGVTSHAFISIYNDEEDPNPKNKTRIVLHKADTNRVTNSFTVINDKEKEPIIKNFEGEVPLDMVHDMDGKLIGTEISKYVGGSADAAKDAALYRLNITKRTLPVLVFMHRIGVSSDCARLFIAQPEVRDVMHQLESNSVFYGSMTIDKACREAVNNVGRKYGIEQKELDALWETVKHDNGLTLRYSELKNNLTPKEIGNNENKKDAAYNALKNIHLFNVLSDLQKSVRNLDTFTRYNASNAMRGTTFLDRFAKRKSIETLKRNLTKEHPNIILPENVDIRDEFENNQYGRLCSMFPYIAHIINGEDQLTENVILDNMHTYNVSFFKAVKMLLGDDAEMDANTLKDIYKGWKNYLLFVGSSRIADFYDRDTALYYTKDFANHYIDTIQEIEKNNPALYKELDKNMFIDSIEIEASNSNYDAFPFLATNIARMSDTEVEKYKRDWEALLDHEETRQLVIDTTIHFLARAAAFSRDTPINVMPLRIKEAIPHYIEAFTDADKVSMSEEELMRFVVMFARNNIDNKNVVPHFRRGIKNTTIDYFEGDQKIVIDKKKASNISEWLIKTEDDNAQFRIPVVVIDEQPFLVFGNLTPGKLVDGTDVYTVDAMPISRLGIPNQMMEYTGFETTHSLFEKKSENPDGQNAPEDIQLIEPIKESKAEALLENTFSAGQRVGTFMQTSPFGSELTDEDYNNALLEDVDDYSENGYIESRTHLKRAEKIANLLGFKVGSIQVGANGSSLNASSYILNIIPEKYGFGHERAKEVAALIGALGHSISGATVSTYVERLENANAIEFAIPLADNYNRTRVSDILDQMTDLPWMINDNRNELVVINKLDNEDVSKSIKKTKSLITFVKNIQKMLDKDGLAGNGGVEVNYTKYDEINIANELNNIKNGIEENEREPGKADRSDAEGRSGNKNREPVRINHLVDAAEKRLKGEKVDDELKELFNEYRQPLKSSDISYRSASLANTVMSAITGQGSNGNLYLEVSDMLSNKENTRRTDEELLNNMILNVANWILGNRSESAILESLERTGLTEESGKNFISLIDDKLKELNIC
jgi:hypothetical protein